MRRFVLAFMLSVGTAACSGNDVTGPSSNGTTPPGAPQQTYTLRGQVSLGVTPSGISAAAVKIEDGPNAGKSAVTDGDGNYAIAGLTPGVMTATVTASGHVPASRAITLSDADATVNWPLLPMQPWTRVGSGDTVFEMPGYFTSVRIQGAAQGECEQFIVRKAGQTPMVNVTLGTCEEADALSYDGTHLVEGGGTIEITSSTAIDWAFNEVRP